MKPTSGNSGAELHMETLSTLSLLRPLVAVFSPVARMARRLHAERHAGQSPFSVRPEQDSLDEQFEEALARLGSIDSNDGWWRSLLAKIPAAYTQPEFFRRPYVQEWLNNPTVKIHFKNLARARLFGTKSDERALIFIREAYSSASGESPYRATYAICVVLAVLHVTVRSLLGEGHKIILDAIKGTQTETIAAIEEISPTSDALHGKILSEELDAIIRRRAVPGIESDVEVEALIQRIEGGDLARTPREERAKAYYWAARILSSSQQTVDKGRCFFDYYKLLPDRSAEDVAFIEALLRLGSNDVDQAIKIFAELNTPDARANIFGSVSRRDGNSAALDWLADNEPYDHTLFSPIGWRNVVSTIMEEGRWQEAGRLLTLLPDETFGCYPDLFFFKGLLHACLLLPEPVRPQLLGRSFVDFRREVQEGDMARQHREVALIAFGQGKESLLALGAYERVRHFDYHMMWLKLTGSTEKNAALDELREAMRDGEKAALMLDIAGNFEVEFDQAPLGRYLRRRKREGREQPYDHGARLFLLHHFGTPRDLLDHLAKEEATLRGVLQPSSLALMKIDALIRDEKVADAATELEKVREAVPAEVFERLRLLVADHKGEDINRLEELYGRTKDYQDLSNLVRYLERTKQPTTLLPYAQQLLATQRTAYNLLRVVRAMTETGMPDDQIVACLDGQSDLLDPGTVEGNELLLHRARALSGTGQFGAAQEITKEVAEKTHEPSAVSLEISLALRAGNWEHFTTIVDREFPRRAELPAALLMQMASVLTDWDPDRALELAGIAAEAEPENGEIQTFAYWLATQMGRDFDGTTWLQRAIALAGEGKGPLQQTTLRELVDSVPSNSARRREWERQYFQGEIGVYQGAMHLNMPVAALVIGELIHNEQQVDARRRSVVPVRHGGRGAVDLSGVHRVAFDLSSLLVLEYLGILGIVFEALDGVDISQRLMDVLSVERRRVRFHQPSLVDRAERFLSLLDDGLLQVAESSDPPPSLVGEIGYDLANLLHLARREGGRVSFSFASDYRRFIGGRRS